MKKRKSVVDASKELVIDTIVLTSEVLDSIRNDRPVPLDNVFLESAEQTAEFRAYEREVNLPYVIVCGLLAISTIILISI